MPNNNKDSMTSKGVALRQSEWDWIETQAKRMSKGKSREMTVHHVTQNLVRLAMVEIKAGRLKFRTETHTKLVDPK